MSSGGQTTTQTSSAAPWAPAQPYLKDSMKEADRLYKDGTGGEIYQGNRTAGLSNNTNAGLGFMRNIGMAGQRGPGGITQQSFNHMRRGGFNPAQMEAQKTMSMFADPSMMGDGNPYLRRAMDISNEDARNQIDMSMSGAGRYGSAVHQGAVAKQISDSNTNAMFSQYNTDANRTMNAAGQQFNMGQQGLNNMGMLYENSLRPSQTLLGVGAAKEQERQNILNDRMSVFDEQQNKPWELLGRRNSIVQGVGQMGGRSTGSSTQPGPNVGQAALGYGLQGLAGGKG